jgi:hypothetical protein
MRGTACCELSSAFSFRRNEYAKITLNWSIAWVEVVAKRGKRWTTPDDERLLKFNDAGTPLPVIAMTLGRTRSDVERRLATLKTQQVMPRSDQPDVSEDE